MKILLFLLLLLVSMTSAFGQQRRSALDDTPTFPPTNTSSTAETNSTAVSTTPPKRSGKTELIVAGIVTAINFVCLNWQPCAELIGQSQPNTAPDQSQMYRLRQNTNLIPRPMVQPRISNFPLRRKY